MTGIEDSLIAAILYSAGRGLWRKWNDPLANAIDRTIAYFSNEKGVEIRREKFAALLEGNIGQQEVGCFRAGERFIDGDKLALQFAIFGELYFEDESETLEIARDVFSHFKSVLTSELLRDPRSSIETLSSIQSIFSQISQGEHKRILKAIDEIGKVLSAKQDAAPLAGSEGEYRDILEEELGTITMLGSGEIPKVPVDLLDTFVSLDITTMAAREGRAGLEPNEMRGRTDQKLSPEAALKRAFKDHRMLLILGDPGSGKTTLVNYYAMLCLKDRHSELDLDRATLPIYLPLREVESTDGELCPLHECLTRWASRRYLDIGADTFYGWLKNRPTLILLDGLDEISDLDKRRQICEWIDSAATGLKKAWFVVTSRWTGYRKADGVQLEFEHARADVRDFSQEQQKEFLEKWFVAAYLREAHKEVADEQEWRKKQKHKALARAKVIIDFLADSDNKGIREMAVVPMLLQVIAILWKDLENLPEGRAELYQTAVKYLLVHRDRPKKIKALLPAAKALSVLRPVSFWMQDDLHCDEVEKERMHERMKPILGTMKDNVGSEEFCENLRDRAGLIADYGKESYIFRHKSFREYLVGRELAVKAEREPDCFKRIVAQFGNDWWNEPLRFFMGEVDAKLFDQSMDALFRSDASKELDQKSHDLLLTIVSEAPQRRIDSLVKFLNDRRFGRNKKRYIVDCLKAIGSKGALQAIEQFGRNEGGGAAAAYAEHIAFEAAGDKISVTDVVKAEIVDKSVKSFRNRYEYNAEYILIPGGSYNYQREGERDVPGMHFAKYPLTNKRYRRFISYLADDEKELSRLLPTELFCQKMLELAGTIEGFKKHLGPDPKQWAEALRSTYDQEKRFKADDQPVVRITWFAARAYCFWLSALEEAGMDSASAGAGGLYRLPTEIEWEWAAGGGKRKYAWAPEKGGPSKKLANYGENEGATTPVGRYPEGATPQGLMDMAGNVCEWMENWYDKDKDARCLRGGSWLDSEYYLRCSYRYGSLPDLRFDLVGFRVVRSQS